jgi:hypothetical protein
MGGRNGQVGGLMEMKLWSKSNAMITGRVVDVQRLSITQEYFTA